MWCSRAKSVSSRAKSIFTQSQSATVSFICTISFFFCQHFKDLYLWHALTDFDQTWYQVPLPPPKHDPGVKGHVGVTGVKKVIFTKNATSPTDYRVWSCDSCTCISLTPSTKVMGLKIHPGSFGVTGVKKVIFTKNATSPTNYRVWSCDSCTYISLTPFYKSYGSKNSPGVIWGHRGQKVIFTKNATSPTVYRVWSCDSCTCISLTPPLQKLWV